MLPSRPSATAAAAPRAPRLPDARVRACVRACVRTPPLTPTHPSTLPPPRPPDQVLAASVVEDEHAKRTGLTLMDVEGTRAVRAALHSPEAQGRAERLMDIVSSISEV